MSLKILLNGSKGRMGQAISSIAAEKGCEISSAVDMGDECGCSTVMIGSSLFLFFVWR